MAKKRWPKLDRFHVPLFRSANIYLCITNEQWLSACDYLGVDGGGLDGLVGACQQYQCNETGENLYLIGVFNCDPATLVHECAHATFYCCRDVGVTIDTNAANETYCYLLDRMFSHFLPHIKQE